MVGGGDLVCVVTAAALFLTPEHNTRKYLSDEKKNRKGQRLIFRASKLLPDGKRIYAKDYGLRGFPIWIPR